MICHGVSYQGYNGDVNSFYGLPGSGPDALKGYSDLEEMAVNATPLVLSPLMGIESGVATAAEESVWNLGWGSRGLAIEQQLGGNLPAGFPVIDNFANGVATSIKSIDLNAATYRNTATLASRLNNYVDSVSGFNGANWANVDIKASQITARQLSLAIPSGSASAAQQTVINAAAARAQGMGVNFIVTPVH